MSERPLPSLEETIHSVNAIVEALTKGADPETYELKGLDALMEDVREYLLQYQGLCE